MLRRGRAAGFTLTELAIVMTIVALLLASVLYTLSAQIESRNYDDTRRRLEQARELVLAFSIANGRLPCPARYVDNTSHSQGFESFCAPGAGTCAGTETTAVQTHGNCSNYYDGYLPAASMGFQTVDAAGFAVDAWNNRIRYVVTRTPPACTAAANAIVYTSSANLKTYGVVCQPPDLLICKSSSGPITAASCASSTNQAVAANVVSAIVFSTGKNFSTAQTAAAAAAAGRADEAANLNGDASFVFHPPAPADAANGEFDDQVLWITSGELYSRLISAGILP
jgi:prepilin-type N-terminal cleavage/methylation domain-containing protein